MMLPENIERRKGINESSPAGINKIRSFFHETQTLRINEMVGFGRIGHMERHDVAFAQEIFKRNVAKRKLLLKVAVGERIMGHDAHPESDRKSKRMRADTPGSHDTDCFSLKIKAPKPFVFETSGRAKVYTLR